MTWIAENILIFSIFNNHVRNSRVYNLTTCYETGECAEPLSQSAHISAEQGHITVHALLNCAVGQRTTQKGNIGMQYRKIRKVTRMLGK